ncbi:MAG: hypothetical protein M5U26_08655 [Planctomycetota bacterium]|nr:hypothetical protein [Planctomycetota bacterium]
MLAFACYLRGRGERAETAAQEPGFRIELRGQHLTLAAVCFGLALSAKVSAVGMLGVLAGWELLLGPDHLEGRTGAGKKLAACAARAGVPLLLALPFLAANWLAARESFGRLLGGSAWGVLIGDLAIAGRYAEVLAWPTSSSPYYAFVPPESLFEARVLLGLGILAAALALTLVLPVEREARRRAAFGWIWCFGAMVTYLNFVPNPEYLHDRYLYLSLPGLGLALLEAARGLAARLRLPAAKLAWPLALGLAALWSALSARESAHWRSDYHLFSHAVAQEPESSHARGYLGLHLGTLALHEHREAGAFAPPGAEPAPSAQAQAWREEALAELERAMACPDIAWNVRRLHFRLAQVVILKDLGRVEASRLKVREMHAEADRNGWDTAPDRSFLARARAIWRDMYPESQARE